MYTSELAELNLAYLSDKKESLPEEVVKIAGQNLTCAAKKYGLNVPENLTDYQSDVFVDNSIDLRSIDETKFIVKSASTETGDRYALPSKEKYPLNTDLQIKKASAYFEKNHKKMDMNDALEFALHVNEAAKDHEVAIDNTVIQKYAELDFSNFNKDLYDHIQVRKSYLKDSETDCVELYDDLLRKSDDLGVTKTAQVMYEIDKKAELTGTYDHGIDNPIFASAGSKDDNGMEIDGILIKESALDSIPSGDLTSIVGNDVIDELRGDDRLHVLASLPRPVRQEIINLL